MPLPHFAKTSIGGLFGLPAFRITCIVTVFKSVKHTLFESVFEFVKHIFAELGKTTMSLAESL